MKRNIGLYFLFLMSFFIIETNQIASMRRQSTFAEPSLVGCPYAGTGKRTRIIVYRSKFWKHEKDFAEAVKYLQEKIEKGRQGIISIDGKKVESLDCTIDYHIEDSIIKGAVGPFGVRELAYEVAKIQGLVMKAMQDGITNLDFWTFGLGVLPFPIVSQSFADTSVQEPRVIGLAHRRSCVTSETDLEVSQPFKTIHGHSQRVEEYTPIINTAVLAGKRRISVISHTVQHTGLRSTEASPFKAISRRSLEDDTSSDEAEILELSRRSNDERHRGGRIDLSSIDITLTVFGDIPPSSENSINLDIFSSVRHFPFGDTDTREKASRCCGSCIDLWDSCSSQEQQAVKDFMKGCAKVALGLAISAVAIVFPPAAVAGFPLVASGAAQIGGAAVAFAAADGIESDRNSNNA